MSKGFGKTWWGKAWLSALERLGRHYANRLPRGRSYARAGNVLSVEISQNGTISALVQGRRRTPYRVTIKLRHLSHKEQDQLVEKVKKSPFVLAQLLSGNLPNELGPHILPAKEDEFDTDCSCPDWANPCKHLAAVLYVLGNEIDRDPFILFRIRGIDPDDFKRRAGTAKHEEGPNYVSVPRQTEFNRIRADLKVIDLSLPMDVGDDVLALLTRVPDTLQDRVGRSFAEIIRNAQEGLSESDPSQHKLEPGMEINFFVDAKKNQIRPVFHKGNWVRLRGTPTSLYSAWRFLLSISPNPRISESVSFASLLARLASSLVESGHIIPRTRLAGDTLFVEWVPLVVGNAEVVFRKMVRACPLTFFPEKKRAPKRFIHPEDGLKLLLAQLITAHVAKTNPDSRRDKLFALLSSREPLQFQSIEDRGLATALDNWLGAFALLRPGSPRLLFSLEPVKRGFWNITVQVSTGKGVFPLKEKMSDDLLRAVHYLSGFFPGMKEIVDLGVVRIPQAQTLELITKTAPFIELMGGKLLLPKEFVRLRDVGIKRRASARAEISSFTALEDLLDFNWMVSVGESDVSLEKFERMVRDRLGLVKIGESWVLVEPDELARFMERAKGAREGFSDVVALVAGEEEIEPDRRILRFLENLRKPSHVPLPKGIRANLRPYQLAGFRWLVHNLKHGVCACLADDMGLGKTLQVISALVYLRENNKLREPALVVCPTSLLYNWKKEIERFAPSLSYQVYHGPQRRLDARKDIVITSYGTVRTDDKIGKRKWGLVVVDEAQNIKNPQAKQTKNLKGLKSELRIAMTGTPIENSLQDLWSIMDFLVHGYLGSWNSFAERFARPIQRYGDSSRRELLRKAISPLVLRRLKSDPGVAPDLPEKIEKDYFCPLTPEQASLYQATLEREFQVIKGSSGIQRKGAVLALITKLKKICNHPAHFNPLLSPDPANSGKTKALLPIIGEVISAGESVLVFTQFREMALFLERMIYQEMEISPLLLHGGVSVSKRSDMVETFRSGDVPVAIFTLKTGGVGLNLEKATHVVHFDLWWNPAVETQATDRAHRIGQTSRVMIHRLMSKGTLEEKINDLLLRKKKLAEDILAHGEKYFTELSDDDLRRIMDLSA